MLEGAKEGANVGWKVGSPLGCALGSTEGTSVPHSQDVPLGVTPVLLVLPVLASSSSAAEVAVPFSFRDVVLLLLVVFDDLVDLVVLLLPVDAVDDASSLLVPVETVPEQSHGSAMKTKGAAVGENPVTVLLTVLLVLLVDWAVFVDLVVDAVESVSSVADTTVPFNFLWTPTAAPLVACTTNASKATRTKRGMEVRTRIIQSNYILKFKYNNSSAGVWRGEMGGLVHSFL